MSRTKRNQKLFVISRDPHPEPWEDYSLPYCVVRGDKEYAEQIKNELKNRYPESFFFVSKVAQSTILEVNPIKTNYNENKRLAE